MQEQTEALELGILGGASGVCEMEGQRCRGEGRVLGVAGELWGQMEGNVSEQEV